MNQTEIRKELHHYIDIADDSEIMQLFSSLKTKDAPSSYTDAEMEELYKRRERMQQGISRGHSVEDVHGY